MATMVVKNAAGTNETVEKPNANGRAAAAASRPIALSTEDLAALAAIVTKLADVGLSAATLAALESVTASVSGTVEIGATSLAALETIEIGATSLAALETTELGATSLAALESISATVTGVATEAKQDSAIAAINGLVGNEYETFAASTAETAIGAAGAAGDLLVGILIVPSTTSPGAVSIKDGTGGTSIPVFAGGASSVTTLHPFFVPLGIRAGAAQGWRITTGAGLTAVAVGNFS